MDKVLECIDDSLELLELANIDWPLGELTSMSICWLFALVISCKLLWGFIMKGNNVFASTLLGATIQDGGKRERSKVYFLFS